MPSDTTKWIAILSKPERLLLQWLRGHDEEEWVVTIEELLTQLRLSKTAIRLALASLTEHGFIAVTPREEPEE